ncbi:MAG: CBS domain-containing protein [Thermoplasmata archaeon]|nr:CBS domain-containing protein [Thermoplasmata archaeon]
MAVPARVEEIMTRDPIVATLPGNRTEVLRLLVTNKITGVPVVRNDGTYAGFVARKHIFAHPEEEQLALLVQKDYPVVSPDAPLDELARTLADGRFYHATVNEDSRVVGIVTPADFLELVDKKKLQTPVEKFLTSTTVAVYEGTPIQTANTIMAIARVFALPVLDGHGRLSGILTDRDVFGLSRIDGSAAIQDMGLAQEEDSWTWEGLRNVMRLYYDVEKVELPEVSVKDVMVREVVTVSTKTGVSEAARKMRKNDYGQLPVMNPHNRLEGLLTELDVLGCLL